MKLIRNVLLGCWTVLSSDGKWIWLGITNRKKHCAIMWHEGWKPEQWS
jgi:hypothetical protein